jgi:CheY-specific phosphatase CheX
MGNTKKIQEMLMNAIFEVFEKMFFIFFEPLNEDGKYNMISSINFTGPINGEIKVFFDISLLETMVQNMLSVNQKDVTEKMMEDCAKEAVNMIGGNFLHKLDSSKVFELSIPMFTKNPGVFVPQLQNQTETAWDLSFESGRNFMAVSVTTSAGQQ